MEDKFINVEDMMVDYAEMTSFDFNSNEFLACNEYSKQPYTFKYGNFDVVDMVKSLFVKTNTQGV